jgi:PKD repeat protein
MRTTQNNNFFDSEVLGRVWVNITSSTGNYNETLIAFKGDATLGVDNAYDAEKLIGNDELALYSKIDEGNYAIQTLPELNMDYVVQLGIQGLAGAQTFSLGDIDGLSETEQIILEDTKFSSFHNLRSAATYNYVFAPETDTYRFKLHFKPAVSFTTTTESCVQNDGELIINSPSASSWNYTVANSSGSIVASGNELNGNLVIPNLNGGVYSIALSNVFGTQIHQAVEVASGAPVQATINSSSTQVDVNDGFVQFNAQVQGATDITWDFGDGSIVTGVMSPAHIYTLPGTYTVTFIASNVTCMDLQTIEITVKDVNTGIASSDSRVFSMYPNPANNTTSIRIDLPQSESLISIFVMDAAGKLVKSEVFNQIDQTGVLSLDVSTLASGVYQILLSGDKISSSSRLTISR